MTTPWVLNFETDDTAIQRCLDELMLLFRRGLLTPEDINDIIYILERSEEALTVSFRDFRSDPTTRTGKVRILLQPSDCLLDLLATFRARPASAAALSKIGKGVSHVT